MEKKSVIFMIIVVLVLLCGQLTAEEVVGESIFPKIETPHPYPKASIDTLVWSETIYQSGAGWLKVHFSDFRLNDDDYVDLIDMYGFVAVRIKGSDVSGEKRSRFHVKKNGNQRVGFWAPRVVGEILKIELHRDTNRDKDWGFTIDEVGVGFEPVPLPFPGENLAKVFSICGTNNLQHIACYSGYEPYDRGQAVGRTTFKRHGNWYRGNGFLLSCDDTSTFLTSAYHVWSQDVVDTLEVEFGYDRPNCDGTGSIDDTTYFGDELLALSPSKKYSLVSLEDNPEEDFTPLEPLDRDPVLYEDIYLVQHPDGDPKKIGFGNVSYIYTWDKYFFHYVDTPYLGSRGSPILTDDGNDNVLDKVLGFDDGDAGSCPNQAVKMKTIYNEIKNYCGCD